MEINTEKIQKKWDSLKNETKRYVVGNSIFIAGLYLVFGIMGAIIGGLKGFWVTLIVLSGALVAVGVVFGCAHISDVTMKWLNDKYPDPPKVRR